MESKLILNIYYYPEFAHVEKILQELHMLLATDDANHKVFPDVSIIGFKNNKRLKDHLFKSVLPKVDYIGNLSHV